MLGYVLRTLPVVLRARRNGALVSRITRRVGLHEIDLNRHMNQAVYAQVTELGRADWLLQTGVFGRWRAAGVNPVVADQHLVYRRELGPLVRYEIDTRAIGLEGRLLHLQAHLLVGDRVHARNDVKLIFVGPGGVLSAEATAEQCRGLLTAPLAVHDWRTTGT